MPGGDVGLGAVRGDTDHGGAGAACVCQVAHTADSGQHQGRDPRPPDHGRDGLDPFQVGVRTETVDATGAGQSVTVGDLDGVDTGSVEGGGNRHRLPQRVLVLDGVHPVAQGDVADIEASHVAAPTV